ncbi:LIM/homeobox protein Lhx9-like [Ctenocephalides felis]|uniref:LIM/homeobox protein Lhx9-like n=1 Tax=Ctenocephalides felis TaxID=7515 RepID=UPI000E6E59D4|nr:LIM/homeobox protein Lhx9-like [Ctenocephalides felis]
MLKDLILQQDPDRGSSDLIDLSNPQSNNNNSNINPNQNPNTTSNENFTNLNEELKNESVPFCFACGEIIRDRFYLLAVDRAWHANCLRCCRCSQPLDSELSCYSRDGNIYCKEDYYRTFSITRCCSGCGMGISRSELVFRARSLVFHVRCFACRACSRALAKGDTAAVRDGVVYCAQHCAALHISQESDALVQAQYFQHGLTPSGLGPQKGRPRKRKTPSITSNEGVSDLSLRMDMLHSDMEHSMDMDSYDGSQSPGSVMSVSGTSRTKRMRTSFKHHQLRTMKSYFAINQNPDAKDLKQLAQKTGLSKRVLQVWFQNARAKWRRNVMRNETSSNSNHQTSMHHHGSAPSNNQPTQVPSGASSDRSSTTSDVTTSSLLTPSGSDVIVGGDNSGSPLVVSRHHVMSHSSLEDLHQHHVLGTGFGDLY